LVCELICQELHEQLLVHLELGFALLASPSLPYTVAEVLEAAVEVEVVAVVRLLLQHVAVDLVEQVDRIHLCHIKFL
jgi:hypothetical protein